DAMAVDGGFITGYAGKIIPSGSTEMMSVGFQHFASTYSAARLCAHDVEHFCLVLGWLTS
ncbi:MAG TPA: hypothetical protein VLC93_15380, partial [Myxococcota bacterium]|nr:hypothetical protein [Myxococcota bacterium]